MGFLFREKRRHEAGRRTDRQMDGMQRLMRPPREGRVLTAVVSAE